MSRILIEGKHALEGEVQITGAKNSVLPILAATLLGAGEYCLRNVPRLADVEVMVDILKELEVVAEWQSEKVLCIDTTRMVNNLISYDLVRRMRASVLLLGALLGRFGEARVSLPGGDDIGNRPIDIHLDGFRRLGASVELQHGDVICRAARLLGTHYTLPFPTVTGTENLLMASSRAQGVTLLRNVANEPEIADLVRFLRAMGADIHNQDNGFAIRGVTNLHGADHRIIPDRIETGTYAAAAVITAGSMRLIGVQPGHLLAVIDNLRAIGADVVCDGECLAVRRTGPLRAVRIHTRVYPGFPTDMQAQFIALLCLAEGESTITENIFENRFHHAHELSRMGAQIRIEKNTAFINGNTGLSGAPVVASDIRASAALVLAGLAAEGETSISEVHHLDRGYERMVEKLAAVGAVIKRVDE